MKKILMRGGLAAATGLLASFNASAASFTVSGTDNTAKTLVNSETGTVNSGATLSVSGGTPTVTMGGSAGLTNSGAIKQTGSTRAIVNTAANGAGETLTVTNHAAGVIESHSQDAFQVGNSSVSLSNSGRIEAVNDGTGTGQAVDWNNVTSKANTLINNLGGVIKATGEDAVRPGTNGVVNNSGTIQAVPTGTNPASGSDGIDTQTRTGVNVTNSGAIEGRHGITGGKNTTAYTISITNNASGTLTGVDGSGINIDNPSNNSVISTATVTNHGTIIGQWDSAKYVNGDGDGVDVDGTVTLTNNGIIRGIGGSVDTTTSPASVNNPQGLAIGGGSVTNNAGAEITGDNPTSSGTVGEGIRVDDSSAGNAFAPVSITNSGLVRGYQGAGVKIISASSNTLVNNAGGTIRGAGTDGAIVATGTGSEAVTNRGAIVGDNGQAIDLGGGDDSLTIEGGAASIQGNVSGGAGNNTLSFDLGAGNSFSYGGSLSNFASVTLGSGTTRLNGANTYTGTTTVGPGATLGGSGSIASPVTVQGGGILSPGNSPGTITLGNLALHAAAESLVELDPSRSLYDIVQVNGTASINLSNLVISLLSAPTLGQTFDILLNDNADAIVGQFSQGSHVTALFAGQTYGFSIDYAANADGGTVGNDIRLVAQGAVPEPGTAFLFGLGGLALARRRKALA